MTANLKTKLSVKTMLGKLKAADLPETGDKKLFVIVGVAKGIKTGTSNFGDWIAFTGQFAAIDRETGERFAGGTMFLPQIATDYLLPVVQNAVASDSTGGVEFEFVIGAKRADTATGYEYTVTPVLAPEQKDPFEALFNRAGSTIAALPAPEVQAESDAESGTDGSEKSTPKKGSKKTEVHAE